VEELLDLDVREPGLAEHHPYYRIFEGYFGDMDQLHSGMPTPEGQAPPADLPNFATGGAAISISEIDA